MGWEEEGGGGGGEKKGHQVKGNFRFLNIQKSAEPYLFKTGRNSKLLSKVM